MNPSPLMILHVDDDANDLMLVKRAFQLTELQSDVASVSDGAEAIDYLSGVGVYADREQYPLPSLILLDLKMPRKNGFEVLTWMRAQPQLKRLPVIILTASNHPEDMNRAYECGANSFLIKPVMLDELAALARDLVHYWGHLNRTASR